MSAFATVVNSIYNYYNSSASQTYTYTGTAGNTLMLFVVTRGELTSGPDRSWELINTTKSPTPSSYSYQIVYTYRKICTGTETVNLTATYRVWGISCIEFQGDVDIYYLADYAKDSKTASFTFKKYDPSTYIWVCNSDYFWNNTYTWQGYDSFTQQLPLPSQNIVARFAIFIDNIDTGNARTVTGGSGESGSTCSSFGFRIIPKSSLTGLWDGRIYTGYYIYDKAFVSDTRVFKDTSSYPPTALYTIVPLHIGVTYDVKISGAGVNRQRNAMMGGVTEPLTSVSYTAFRYIGDTTNTPTLPIEFSVTPQAGEDHLFIYLAGGNGSYGDISIEILESSKFLIGDGTKIYNIQNDTYAEISGITENDLSAAVFAQYGFVALLSSYDYTNFATLKIYKHNPTNPTYSSAALVATPNAQPITKSLDFSDETILGFSGITAVYEGNVSVQYSYDNSAWSNKYTMADFLNIDLNTLYSGLLSDKILYIKILLEDENASFTRLTISCTNEEE